MPTLAIVGAGPGLGLSIARRFGREGFDVALLARSPDKLAQLVAELADAGVPARAYPADVTVPDSLTGALAAVERELGQIDVLEYSPAPAGPSSSTLAPVTATDLTIDSVAPQIQYYLYGAIAALQAVLPQMRARRSGTILVTTGASSGPLRHPPFGNIAAATGALRNWVLNLNEALRDDDVYAAHVAIAAWIGHGGPDSDPDRIADQYWDLYQRRDQAELFWQDSSMAL
ncbi:MAG: SDR family NAD(P)-dependent oxidoreductase [Janthinobacterium lividum]